MAARSRSGSTSTVGKAASGQSADSAKSSTPRASAVAARRGRQPVRDQDPLHPRAGDHAGQHRRASVDRQRRGTQAGGHGPQIACDEEGTILRQQPDAVPAHEPFAQKPGGAAAGAGAKLAVRQHFVADDDGGRLGVAAGQNPSGRIGRANL